jgi:hypothetical protein
MLHTSTKNVAQEVISCLITVENFEKQKGTDNSSAPKQIKGVLTNIIKWLTMTNQ